MTLIDVIVEVQDGIANITRITAPPGVKVCVTIRDYDIEGADAEELTVDEDGIPCFESDAAHESLPDRSGFV